MSAQVDYRFTQLDELESESIHIFRCVRAVLTSALLIMLKQSMCCVKVGASISIPC